MELEYKVQPWQHQLEGIRRANETDSFGFFYQVGSGKTLTAINAARYKFAKHKRLLKTLVVAPPIVLENWRKEWLANSKVNPKDIVVLYGTGKQRLKMLEQIGDTNKIIITNYETLTMGSKKDPKKKTRTPGELFQKIYQWAPEMFILDESHRCKDQRTARSTACIKIADLALYKFILTGTPVLNSMEDLFSQFRILDGGRTFGKNYFQFRNRYFQDNNAGMPSHKYYPDWQPKRGAAEEINKLVARRSMYVTKADCLDLPPLVKKTIEIGMSKEQEKAYVEMRQQLITYIEKEMTELDELKHAGEPQVKAAVAEYAMTKALRLQQIVSGFVNLEEGGGERTAHKFKDNPRKKALKELLTDIAPYNKCLVWAVFKENYADIREVCEKLKLDYVEVHGGVTQKQKIEAVERLNNDPKCRVLIGHPGSGGIGINLVSASHSIFYSRSFSLEYDIQAEARNYRGGSEVHEKVTRIDLVTQGTVDEQVLKALASKKSIGYQVLKKML